MKISQDEFRSRIDRIRSVMEANRLDGLMVYGDEYRKENLRYISNFWPIFERGACFIPRNGNPILAGAPEGEMYAREMSAWSDVRNIKDFACVSVPEEIDYPLANFTTLPALISETLQGGNRLGIVGRFDIPGPIYQRIEKAADGVELIDANQIIYDLRLIKTPAEIACLREAGRLACLGYEQLMKVAVPGNTELQAAGAAEGAARSAGAEFINFTVFGSGARAATIIGRGVNKVIADGDMVMAAFAVQYEGYVSTVQYPFVAGKATDGQKRFLAALFEAANEQQKYLRDGVFAADMVKAVKSVFTKHGLSKYDVYPPMHGIGLAEAESPYPDVNATYHLKTNMCVNSDVSLFGHPDGSNRIEEGFVITESGPQSLTPSIRKLVASHANAL